MDMFNKDAAIVLSRLDLGSSVAETDALLESARIETSVFDDLLADRVDLIPGTKGSGKTALYRIFVDFLPALMLQQRRVVIAHGVQQRQDTVFRAYKEQFDALSESDFIDFWCIYIVSLANEQFIKNPMYHEFLDSHTAEIESFQNAYQLARIPDFDQRKSFKEIIAWALAVVSKIKPTVKWKAPGDAGQIELGFELEPPQAAGAGVPDGDPRMPAHIDSLATSLEQLLERADLSLWLMIDRLDELFARRSQTERRALRGLLRTLQLFRSDRIRVKIFLRDDIFEQIVAGDGFAGLTHITARMSDRLAWSEEQILAMIVRRLAANAAIQALFDINQDLLKTSMEYRRQTFYKVFSDTVYRGPNQSRTLSWIYSHTRDGKGVVTPRDVIDLLVRAGQRQRDDFRGDPNGRTDRLIHGPAIAYGLDALSKAKRINYLEAEFSHMWENIQKLVGGGIEYSEAALHRLFGPKADRTIEDLVSIGVLYAATRKGSTTYRVPFLYREGLDCTQRYIS
jgi:hypothetical protein